MSFRHTIALLAATLPAVVQPVRAQDVPGTFMGQPGYAIRAFPGAKLSGDLVENSCVLTPAEVKDQTGATAGSIFQFQNCLTQVGNFRPILSLQVERTYSADPSAARTVQVSARAIYNIDVTTFYPELAALGAQRQELAASFARRAVDILERKGVAEIAAQVANYDHNTGLLHLARRSVVGDFEGAHDRAFRFVDGKVFLIEQFTMATKPFAERGVLAGIRPNDYIVQHVLGDYLKRVVGALAILRPN